MIKNILTILLALFGLVACDTKVAFEGVAHQPQTVIYGKLLNDSTVYASISESAPVKGDFAADRGIDNAEVYLIQNEKDSILLDSNGDGTYGGFFVPDVTANYKLMAYTRLGEVISEDVRLPLQPKLIDAELSFYSKGYYDYTHKLTANFDLAGFPRGSNAFAVSLIAYSYEKAEYYELFSTFVEGGEITFCGGFNGTEDIIYEWAADCWPDDVLKMEMAFSAPFAIENSAALFVKVASTSESFINFESSFYDYESIDLFFEEPLPPYSNFDNGYGYFGAFNAIEFSLSFPE